MADSSMLEIEMKFRVADFAAVERTVAGWGATRHPAHIEADHYHNAPDRDFAVTGEAFRLRRVGDVNVITYKGPKEPGPTKTRTEIEIPLKEGDAVADDYLRLLGKLGYRPNRVVRKTRESLEFERDGFTLAVCLDEVERLGKFVEVEILALPERREAAQATLLAVVRDLGLTEVEPRSYLRMALEADGGKS